MIDCPIETSLSCQFFSRIFGSRFGEESGATQALVDFAEELVLLTNLLERLRDLSSFCREPTFEEIA